MTWFKKTLNTDVIIPDFLKLHSMYKTICINRHFLNKVFFHSLFRNLFSFHLKWHSRAMIFKSRRAGRLATSKAICILALEVQLGGQSCVGAENACGGWGAGGTVGWIHLRRYGGGEKMVLWEGGNRGGGGEYIYDDFSFLALGESAPWEFTPFTPLAKNKGHIQIWLINYVKCM